MVRSSHPIAGVSQTGLECHAQRENRSTDGCCWSAAFCVMVPYLQYYCRVERLILSKRQFRGKVGGSWLGCWQGNHPVLLSKGAVVSLTIAVRCFRVQMSLCPSSPGKVGTEGFRVCTRLIIRAFFLIPLSFLSSKPAIPLYIYSRPFEALLHPRTDKNAS